MPYLGISVNSTTTSSFKSISVGSFWLWTVLSVFVVSLTSNSVFIPKSILCLANISRISNKIFSTGWFSVSVSSVSAQSNRLRKLLQIQHHHWGSVFFWLHFVHIFEDTCLYLGVFVNFARRFRCCELRGAALLFYLATGSKYSCMEIEQADRYLLRPCAILLLALSFLASIVKCGKWMTPRSINNYTIVFH